jgi:pimeloyl-ACP methyl ester carboxylesterase
MRDAEMTLPDGRTLACTDLGDSRGATVMYFHGAPTSRLDLVGFEDLFTERGLRVVSADRPGYGRSSPQPGRTMRDWPADVAALADHLDIDEFIVVAYRPEARTRWRAVRSCRIASARSVWSTG